MSLVIYKQPKAIDLAGNHLFFEVKGTDYLAVKGAKAMVSLSDFQATRDYDTLHLTFMGKTHKFFFSESRPVNQEPPIPGYDFILPAGPEGIPLVPPYLSQYIPIALYYNVYMDSNGRSMIIEAKKDGPLYNITADVVPAAWEIEPGRVGVDEVYRANYHARAKLSVENLSKKGTYISIPEFRLDADGNQLFTIYLGDMLKRIFINHFDLPNFEMDDPSKALVSQLQYKIDLQEMDGSNQLATLTIGPLKAIKGKVNNADHPEFDLRQWLNSTKSFLTNQPRRIHTYLGAKHYLYWLNPLPGSSTVRVKMEGITTDAANPTISYLSAPYTLQQDEVLLVPVTDLLMQQPGANSVMQLAVSVVTGSVVLAGEQQYLFSRKRMFARAFIFQNRFGVFDTITTQFQENTVKVEKDENRRMLTPGYSRYVGDMSSDEAEIEDIFTAETGPIPAAMAAHFKELVSSGSVFLQKDDRFVRIWIDKGSFNLTDDADELQNVKFKYKPAFAGDMLNTQIRLPEAPHEDYSNEYLKTDYQ